MRAAAEMLGCNYPITYIIVQKRHKTRLFPKDSRDADKNGNVKPGKAKSSTANAN